MGTASGSGPSRAEIHRILTGRWKLRDNEPCRVGAARAKSPFSLLRFEHLDEGPLPACNVDSNGYSEWFRPFAAEIHRILKDSGSFAAAKRTGPVIDIGSAWNRGRPTRSLYQFKLLIMLCDELMFHLAQDFYWWNPAKIPSPAEWVTIRRVRVKDAVNTVWWLSKTPWPKASNRRVLQPYSERMRKLLANGAPTSTERPSGHDIDGKFKNDNQGAIPPNLLAIANTDSNSRYLRAAGRRAGSRILRDSPGRCPSTSSGSSPTAETM